MVNPVVTNKAIVANSAASPLASASAAPSDYRPVGAAPLKAEFIPQAYLLHKRPQRCCGCENEWTHSELFLVRRLAGTAALDSKPIQAGTALNTELKIGVSILPLREHVTCFACIGGLTDVPLPAPKPHSVSLLASALSFQEDRRLRLEAEAKAASAAARAKRPSLTLEDL